MRQAKQIASNSSLKLEYQNFDLIRRPKGKLARTARFKGSLETSTQFNAGGSLT
ncbi:8568_t:CDS:2 [Rhizophagus irregularis]|nr:8568_t:CDS:2 [Rhizophagus irregularis]